MNTTMLLVLILVLILSMCAMSGYFSTKWWERYATLGILTGVAFGYVFTRTQAPFYPTLIGAISVFFIVKILIHIISKRENNTPFGILAPLFCIGTALSCMFPPQNLNYFYAFIILCIAVEWLAYALSIRIAKQKNNMHTHA